MARDLFGNVMRTDIFGRKISKKQIKKDVLEENRRKGRAAEEAFVVNANLSGYEVERTGRGHDYRIRKRDLAGRVVYSGVREIKSGNAKLSVLQEQTKKKKSNYKVIRHDPMFY